MSKKLIAVASAAALALTALVGIAPANASSSTALTGGSAAGFIATVGETADVPATLNVPAGNTLIAATSATVGRVDVGAADEAKVSVTATGAVRLIRTVTGLNAPSLNWDVTKLGTTSLSYEADGTSDDDFHAYTTSTSVGTFSVSITTATTTFTKTYYLKGLTGAANRHTVNNVVVPAALADTKTATVSFTVADIFGNAIEDMTDAELKVTADASKATFAIPASGTNADGWDSSSKTYKVTMTSASDLPMIVNVNLGATASPLGFAKIADKSAVVVNSAGASSQITTLTAQIATLTATVAKRVSKKKYNTLARKWNAAFPSQKVALKK
jgi:hypothetical protein